MHVPQVYKLPTDDPRALALVPHVHFLKCTIPIEDDFCTVALKDHVNAGHQPAFLDLLISDDGANCIMTNLGPKGDGTLYQQREAAFKKVGADVYKKGATFL